MTGETRGKSLIHVVDYSFEVTLIVNGGDTFTVSNVSNKYLTNYIKKIVRNKCKIKIEIGNLILPCIKNSAHSDLKHQTTIVINSSQQVQVDQVQVTLSRLGL